MIIKDAYPGSEKVYLNGELFPYLRVGMSRSEERRVGKEC